MKEKKKVFVPIILLVLIILASALTFFIKNKKQLSTESENTNSTKMRVSDDLGSDGDFIFERLLSGENKGSFQCHYEFNEEDRAEMAEDSIAMTSYEGDYYFADGLIAMYVVQNGVEMNTLVLEDYTYTWSSDSNVGMRMPNTADDFEEEYDEVDEIGETDYAESEQVGRFDRSKIICKNWDKDSSVFAIPENISFNDMGSYMDASANMTDDYAEMAKEYESMEIEMDMVE